MRFPFLRFAMALGLLPPGMPCLSLAQEKVVSVIQSFDSDRVPGIQPITYWRWSDADKKAAATHSQLELVEGEAGRGRALRVSIPKALPAGLAYFPFWSTGLDYLPPETESLRFRARVLSGRFELSAGSPTVYFGNSDAQAKPQVLEPGGWRTVELSLVRDLWRNYRRPIFSQESPVIHYTRWIQEPMRLLLSAESQGELLIDDIELVGRGKGRPFPAFAPGQSRPLGEADLAKAFTFATDDREFELSHAPDGKPVRPPAVLRPLSGERGVLEARQRGTEEMSFIGLPLRCPDEANAFQLSLKASHARRMPEVVVDLVAIVAPDGAFPWERTRAENASERGFGHCLSPRATADIPWGFYHARRTVPNGEWTDLIVPFADFVCGYGTGPLKERHQKQQPIVPGEVVALALLSPYGQRDQETVFTFEKAGAAQLSGDPATWISYPQVPDLSLIQLERIPGGAFGGLSIQRDPP